MFKHTFSKALCVLLFCCATITNIFGQAAVSGGVTGTVQDITGSVITGAAVRVKNVRTQVVNETTSNESGTYNVVSLIPGTYSVTIEQAGFKQTIRENVEVRVDTITRVDAELQAGNISEVVTINEASPILQTERAEISQVIDRQKINNLPTLGRNVSRLVQLAPGAAVSGGQLLGHPENAGDDFRININGQGHFNSNRQIDGVDNNETIQGQSVIVPTVDSLQEIKITTSNYDAEFGQVAGAVIQASTRSGSNNFHGSLFEFHRNSATFSRDPFSEPEKPARFIWNQFGGSIGGPIVKQKLFFFGDYQGTRSVLGGSILTTVPTQAFRNGDFSAVAATNPIYDPLTGNADGTGRIQFPNNIIPANRISPVSRNLLGLIPDPTIPNSLNNNFAKSDGADYSQNQFDARIDFNQSDKAKMFGRYSFYNTKIDAPTVFGPVAGGSGLGGLQDVGNATTRSQNLALNHTYAFNPKLLTETRVGVSLLTITILNPDSDLSTARDLGIPNINLGSVFTNGLPGLNISGPTAGFFFGRNSLPFFEDEKNVQLVSNWNFFSGNHSFKWGADIKKAYLRRSDKNGRGSFDFSQSITGLAGISNSGLGLASFLLGLPSSYSRSITADIIQEQQWRQGYFFQDNWTISPKLSLNLGLRYEYFSPVYADVPGGITNFDTSTGEIILGNLAGRYAGVNKDLNNFSPRIGLVYRVTPRTVFRTGFGRSYALNAFGANFGTQSAFYPNQNQFSVTANTPFTSVFPLSQGPPPPSPLPELPSTGRLILPNNIGYIFPGVGDYPITYVDSWNATVQHELLPGLATEIAYVGNVGRGTWLGLDLNLPVPGPGPFNPRRPFFNSFGLTQGLTTRRAFGTSSYHSLQAKIEKSFSNGFSALSSFTWSKALDWSTQNPFDLRSNIGPSGNNRDLISVTSFTYELPFGQGKRFGGDASGFARYVLGGWAVNGVINLQSGLPLTPTLSSNSSLNSPVTLRPNRIGSGEISDPDRNRWFDSTVFTTPAPFTYGNSGRGILEGPGIALADLSLFKVINFTEATRLDLRWEVFNAFNRTNLNNPNTTIGSTTVGRITSVSQPMRRMQFGAHLRF